ncbi:MAG: hypothetical protein RIC35_20195 [Marinoscillum sp.]
MRLFLVLLISLSLFGCEPEYSEPYTSFLLPEGSHGQSLRAETLQSTKCYFKAIFDESAIYQTEDPVNQYDINKLMGFSDCNSVHHVNSARFGWRWLDDLLEIHAYVYVNGERFSELVGVVPLNEPSSYEIAITKETYRFKLNELDEVVMPRGSTCDQGAYYMLWPYFGGDETAPHDIKIKIQRDW